MEKSIHTIIDKTYRGGYLQRMYEARFRGGVEYRDRVWRSLIQNYFHRWLSPKDIVLDLGAGYGEFINNITCGKKYAMDLNPDTVYRAHPEIEVFKQDCSTTWPLPDDTLDVVFTSNFFEHLPEKQTLERTLDEVLRCLKHGGRLIAMGPNIRYLPGVYWDFWDHHLPLTDRSLSEVLRHKGFRIEKCLDKFLPYTMVGGLQYPPFFIATYLKLSFAWRFFGKQFLIVAQKGNI